NLLCIVSSALDVVFGKIARKQPVAHYNACTQIFRTVYKTAISCVFFRLWLISQFSQSPYFAGNALLPAISGSQRDNEN
ncbi:MAG: hypothetical protein FWC70_08780, partial [Defluviitaleaceae bacterium]|nr:hypothetical protein [Defluviitaleaceae bacterium]